ncbi:hypothetical protein [Defluviimonas sp. WL0075]|uniref:Uncharacterized protein n=1 Tax=Albidovulum sediminicola TaxID=2984331 RepID=A0ABT2YXE0_9RHOB|nr:hypothetical protein [Defluviimonas sp. WL0075]MCV2863544.1 hypothetical protein [Defluviimonas sp. WL0075]
MKVELAPIRHYLRMLTESRVAAQGDPMENVSDMDEPIDEMAASAQANGDDDLLRLVIDALAADPDGRLDPFRGSYYGWSDAELVDLLVYAHDRIWPDYLRSLPGDEAEIEFVETPAAVPGRG